MRFSLLPLALIVAFAGRPAMPAAAPAPVVFRGMCDASAAVPLDANTFAVVDDEDNILRIYDVNRGGLPLRSIDLSPGLPLRSKKAKPEDPLKAARKAARHPDKNQGSKKAPELDLEAGTALGDIAFWLTSHGRNRKGKKQNARYLLFGTTLPRPGQSLGLVGQPYPTLLEDLLIAEALQPFDLASASERPPKDEGGLNIEGLTAMPGDEAMYIGFRNPVPQGKALLVPLLNPRDVLFGQRARLGDPVLLDLGGQGIRALSWWHNRYLIIAGAYVEGGTSHLYTWTGKDPATPVPGIDLSGFNPEAFFTPENRDDIVLFSDDGSVQIDGTRCKDLEDPAQKRFRSLSIRLTPTPTALSGASNPN
jgi:hypothetical protein